jgi:hypothetical protein
MPVVSGWTLTYHSDFDQKTARIRKGSWLHAASVGKNRGFPSASWGRNQNIKVRRFFFSRQGPKALWILLGRQESRKNSREAATVNSPDRQIGGQDREGSERAAGPALAKLKSVGVQIIYAGDKTFDR